MKSFFKHLRSNQTNAENTFWYFLRAKRLAEFKFRRQVQIGPYIVDFICYEKRLIIELDGGQHNDPKHQEYDCKRTAYLESQGFKVIRFWNNEALKNKEGVLIEILKHLE